MAGIIGRKFVFRIEIDPHQIPNRVLVFHPIQPAQRDATRIRPGGVEGECRVFDPTGHAIAFGLGGLKLLRRRHDAFAHVVQHGQPQVVVLQIRVTAEFVQRHPSLRHAKTVAVVAVFIQHLRHLGPKTRQQGLVRRRDIRRAERGQGPAHHDPQQGP